ncbi:Oxysterol-binding protein [Atractiella rhizophila]|nr:Oxysterol-binding protein [Atractiella rhizophila]
MPSILGIGTTSSKEKAPEGSDPNDTEVLDDEPKSILLSLISQLRIGMDLHKVTLPTFVLEPRSMLERITDFLTHSDLLFGADANESEEERFIAVMRYYLAGWHIKPAGVKKPYNPVLGEIFRCRYNYQDGSVGLYVAEQVSHHPPISCFAYFVPKHSIYLYGELRPTSRFLGNSAATLLGGTSKAVFLGRPEDKEYVISMPNMYARGLLFGKMVLELGDQSEIRNPNGMNCMVEFKTKGFFSGTYNAIAGKIKNRYGSEIGEVSGKWSDQIEITRGKAKQVLFDAHSAVITEKTVTPESEQEPLESRRLWSKVTEAIKKKDMNAATEEKTVIEDRQREEAKAREARGEKFTPRFFELRGEEYHVRVELPKSSPEEQLSTLEKFIFSSLE